MWGKLRDQFGLITRSQAKKLGFTRRMIGHRMATGEFVRVARGVYRHASWPSSWRSELLAHVLASGGVASHRCAAALHKLEGWSKPRVEVTIPYGRSYRADGVRVHHSKQWDRRGEVQVDGIPCTSIDRTILDLGAVASLSRVEKAAESAIRSKLLDWPHLRTCLLRHSVQGRDGCGRLRLVLESRYGDDPIGLSDWSHLVKQMLSDAGLPEAALEHRIFDSDRHFILQADLAWPNRRVAVELDSVRWHLNRASFEADRWKRNRARVEGWIIHEVTWSMFSDNPRSVVELVRATLFNEAA